MVAAPPPAAESILNALLDALDEGVLVFDDGGVCRLASRRAAELLGASVAELTGAARPAILAGIAARAGSPEGAAALGALGDASAPPTLIDPLPFASPLPRTLAWTSTPLGAAGGRLEILRDVTRERHAEEAQSELERRLEVESGIDEETGLTSRRRFDEEHRREHRRAQREWVPYALARIAVPPGDEGALRLVGEGLRVSRREYDVVARFQGAELVLLLPRVEPAGALLVVRRALDEARSRAGEGAIVGAGVSVWIPPSSDGPDEVLERSGRAAVRARERGLGKIEVDAGAAEWGDGSAGG